MIGRLVVTLLLILSGYVTQASNTTPAACSQEACVTVGEWEIGVAIGLGARSNPLVGGDTIPMVVLPDIAYYGEAFYFDNFELGYQFYMDETYSLETYVKPNMERAFFSFWHPDNIFLSLPANSAETPGSSFPDDVSKPDENLVEREVSIDDVEKRDWSVDAGLRWQYYSEQYRVSIFYATDVSRVHNGFYGGVNIVVPWTVSNWRFASSFGTTYKSEDLIDYYYGVSEQDTEFAQKTYMADGGWQYNFSTTAFYPFSQKWQFLIRAEIIRIHDSMFESPLVEDKHVTSVFSGMVYRF